MDGYYTQGYARDYWSGGLRGWYDERALQKLTAVLSSKTGIRVCKGEHWAYDTRNKILYYNPNTFYAQSIDAIFGVLLHEIGHALFTPPKPLSEISPLFNEFPQQMGWLLNSCENRRIELLLRGVYPHAEKFLKQSFDENRYERETYDEERERLAYTSWYGDYWKEQPAPLSFWLAEEIDTERFKFSNFVRYPMPPELEKIWKAVFPLVLEYEKQSSFDEAAKIFAEIAERAKPLFEKEDTNDFKSFLRTIFQVLDNETDDTASRVVFVLGIGGSDIGGYGGYERTALDTYQTIRKRVLPQAYSLVSRLKPLLLERKKIKEDFGYRSGKLDIPRLWKHRTGSTRLFKKSEMLEGFVLPPFVLISDFSASMEQADIKLAVDAMATFSIALSNLKTPHSIIGFSNEAVEVKTIREREMSQTTIAKCETIQRGGTEDYLAVEKAIEILKAQKLDAATQPIIIVFTDGASSEPALLRKSISEAKKKVNALVIGIGIGDASELSNNYSRCITIESTAELPKVVGSLIKQEMTKLLRKR